MARRAPSTFALDPCFVGEPTGVRSGAGRSADAEHVAIRPKAAGSWQKGNVMRIIAVRALIGATSAGALLAQGILVAPAASALTPEDTYAAAVAEWAKGIADHEVFARPLPLVGISPGSLFKTARPELGADLSKAGDRYTLRVAKDVATSISLDPVFALSTRPESVRAEAEVSIAFSVTTDEVDGVPTPRVVASGDRAPQIKAGVTLDGIGVSTGSVGILGVEIDDDKDDPVRVSAAWSGTISDPDGDGYLDFDRPGGNAGDGELAAEGSAAKLPRIAFDGTPRASGTFSVRSSGSALAEPAKGTVKFTWPGMTDWAKLDVDDEGFAGISDFLTMSIRDTGEGIALAGAMLDGLQRLHVGAGEGNVDLPYMRGTVADLLHLSENLAAFLRGHITKAGEPNEGQPTWNSVQELFDGLAAAPGISVRAGEYDPGNHRLPFTLKLERDAKGVAAHVPTADGQGIQTGLVDLGGLLGLGKRGVHGAVAGQPRATYDPNYTVELDLAFDLQPSKKHDPPLKVTHPDGTVTYHESTPAGTDRTLVKEASAQADFPLATAIDAAGTAGALGVTAGGKLAMTRDDGGEPMLRLKVSNKDYRPILAVVEEAVKEPAKVVDLDLNAAVKVTDGIVRATGLPDFFPKDQTWSLDKCSIAKAPEGCKADLDGIGSVLTFDIDPAKPRELLGRVAQALQVTDVGLRTPELLTEAGRTKLPVLNMSIADALLEDGKGVAIATPLTAAVDDLAAGTPGTLQQALDIVDKALGKPVGVRYEDADDKKSVVLDLDYTRRYTKDKPLVLDTKGVSVLGAESTGVMKVSTTVTAKAGVVVGLDAVFTPTAKTIGLIDPSVAADLAAEIQARNSVSLLGFAAELGTAADPASGAVGFRATLAKSGRTDLSTVLGVDPALTAKADCGGDKALLCAKLPVYLQGEPVSADAAKNSFGVTVPDRGKLSDSLKDIAITYPDLAALKKTLRTNPFDISSMPNNLMQYLLIVQNGMTAASLGGRLPLIGKELAHGSAALGELHERLTGIGDLAGEEYARAKSKIEEATGASITENCGTLAQVTGVKAKATQAGTAAKVPYHYSVVAYQATYKAPTQWSDRVTVQNAATLSTADYNEITWSSVPNAAGYLVVRSADDGKTWQTIGDVPGTSFTDDGTGTPTDPPEDIPELMPLWTCDDLTTIQAVTFTWSDGFEWCKSIPVDIGIPGLALRAGADAERSDDCNRKGGVQASLDAGFTFSATLDRDQGFVIRTTNPKNAKEAYVSVSAKLLHNEDPGESDLEAELAIFQIAVDKRGADKDSAEVRGGVSIDLVGEPMEIGGVPTEAVTLTRLVGNPGEVIKVAADINVDIDWKLAAHPGVAGQTLPGLGTNFSLTWGLSADTVKPVVGGSTVITKAPEIEFSDITFQLGSLLEGQVKPAINEVNRVLDPLRPILETINSPIRGVSDLSKMFDGPDITLLWLATAANTLAGGPQTKMFETVGAVAGAVTTVSDVVKKVSDSGGVPLDIGDLTVNGTAALTSAATPAQIEELKEKFTPAPVTAEAKAVISEVTGPAMDKAGFSLPLLEHPEQLVNLLLNGDVDLIRFDSGPLALEFTYLQKFGPIWPFPPVFITVGGTAGVQARVIAGFDTYGLRNAVEGHHSGKRGAAGVLDGLYLATKDQNNMSFPALQFSGGLSVGAALDAGIVSAGVDGGIYLGVSFFWKDPNNDGKFRFFEFTSTAKQNPLCLFETKGQIGARVSVWAKLRLPFKSLKWRKTIVDITLLDFSYSKDCSEPTTPILATASGDTLVIHLGRAGTEGFRNRGWGAKGTEPETFKIYERHDYAAPAEGGPRPVTGFAVEGLGLIQEYPGAFKRVVIDGRDSTTPFHVSLVGDGNPKQASQRESFRSPAVIYGSEGPDKISTDAGPAWVDGRGGDDILTAANGPGTVAVLAGGAGGDQISTSTGDSVVAGDSGLPETNSIEVSGVRFATAVGAPAMDGPGEDDTLAVGTGTNRVYGNGGDDTISVTSRLTGNLGSNLIVGGRGNDSISGGHGDDLFYPGEAPSDPFLVGGAPYVPGKGITAEQRAALADAAGTADGTDDPETPAVNTVDTGAGSDLVIGSAVVDLVQGGSLGSAKSRSFIFGGAGNDVLAGGFGSDEVFGGPGEDYVLAEPGELSEPDGDDGFGPARTITTTPLPKGETAQSDLLVGGTGRDHIVGGAGGTDSFGDQYLPAEMCIAGEQVASDGDTPGADETGDGSAGAADLILGGAGVDVVRAGGGNDRVRLEGANDRGCGQSGNDDITGGTGADRLWGGSGDDVLGGGDDADNVFGNAGNDTAYGNDGEDTIEGNAGADTLFGGADDDLLVGGTRAAGRPDDDDILYGEDGVDVLLGDNGAADEAAPLGYRPLDFTGAGVGGADQIFGAVGADLGFGGVGPDVLHGGPGADHLEGGPNPADAPDSLFGEEGADDLIGGSYRSAPDQGDLLDGGADADVLLGDNANVVPTSVDDAATPVLAGRATKNRTVRVLDTGVGANAPSAEVFGPDRILGGAGDDAAFGQGGADSIAAGDGADLAVGGRDADTIAGDGGRDDLIGGDVTRPTSKVPGALNLFGAYDRQGQPDAGDTITGGAGADILLGDNGVILPPAGAPNPLLTGRDRGTNQPRDIHLFDLGANADADDAGNDLLQGDAGEDVILGQGGDDRIQAGAADDAAEGGPGIDWIEGGTGSDDLIGGSTTAVTGPTATEPGTGTDKSAGQSDAGDVILGHAGDDAVLGDNGLILRGGTTTPVLRRASTDGTLVAGRTVIRFDQATANGGSDYLLGGDGVDALWGQDGADAIFGGKHDDYAEGNGGNDALFGDQIVAVTGDREHPAAGVAGIAMPVAAWPGEAASPAEKGPDGQDDLIGGSSVAGFRDGDDRIQADGESDVVLGDNGSLLRDPVESGGSWTDRTEVDRYPENPRSNERPDRLFTVRVHNPAALPAKHAPVTRFCTPVEGRATCEADGAFGADVISGGSGDDRMWGQDGDDTIHGGAGNDDLVGELGDDVLNGDAGQDTLLGDRGGIVGQYIDSTAEGTFTRAYPQAPADSFTGLRIGSLDRRVDLASDVEDRAWTATKKAPMPLPGTTAGGADRLRGGDDHDVIFGGAGNDLANGDNGGDSVFGGAGADVLWGGRGNPDGSADRGTEDEYLDLVFGGASVAGDAADSVKGADIIDWRPRGSYGKPSRTTCTDLTVPEGTIGDLVDPCSWFEMTDLADADPANDQINQGTDWLYGGWDRDVLQSDTNGKGTKATEDRLIDWDAKYNLFSTCQPTRKTTYDVRAAAPQLETFIRDLAYGAGAGRARGDVSTAGTSAWTELAFAETGDAATHSTGKKFGGVVTWYDEPATCGAGG